MVKDLQKRLCELNVGGTSRRGTQPKGWMGGTKDAVEKRERTVENSHLVCRNDIECRAIVSGIIFFNYEA